MAEVLGAGPGRVVWWKGLPPAKCDSCGKQLSAVFVDCKSTVGVWGEFCVECAGDVAVSAHPSLCRVFQWTREGWVSIF
jgi:hypothetical protein